MALRSSSSVTVQARKRHHTNTRMTIMKTKSVQHLQIPPFNTRSLETKIMRRRSKPKPNTTINPITSTPSIALLLAACHSLDHLICSPTTSQTEINKWHALDLWTYLTSSHRSVEVLIGNPLSGIS
ncbi:hypothetical protein BDZ45DRAFT_679271 [Acephala macrosclerotiorum]|nr:hypothetical protein BDZ45DRAFT_679271 [Acephala macrosclerotiorum]